MLPTSRWKFKGFAVLSVAFLALSACLPTSIPSLQPFALDGDPANLQQFQGTWFDYDGIAMVRVERRWQSSWLYVRIGPDFVVEDAVASRERLHFRLRGPDHSQDLEFRFIEPDVLVWTVAGGEVSWCGTCTPRYSRSWRMAFFTNRLEAVWRKSRELLGRAEYWIAGAL